MACDGDLGDFGFAGEGVIEPTPEGGPQALRGRGFVDEQVVSDFFGDALKGGFVGISGDGDAEDLVFDEELFDDGFFSLFGEVVDGIDASLDVGHDVADVVAGFDFEDDVSVGLAGDGLDSFDAFEALNGFFDGDADAFLDFLRGGVRVGDADADHVEDEVREDFFAQ